MAGSGSRVSRRGALLSLPRGVRSIAVDNSQRQIIVGTCLASGANELHCVSHNTGAESLSQDAVYHNDAEIWGICARGEGSSATTVAVAARERGDSSLRLWRLMPDVDTAANPEVHSVPHGEMQELCSASVSGKSRSVKRYGEDELVVCSSSEGSIYRVDASCSSVARTSTLRKPKDCPSYEGEVVCVEPCLHASAVLVATRRSVSLHDLRSPSPSDALFLLRDDTRRSVSGGESGSVDDRSSASRTRIPSRCVHISSAAAGPGHVVAAGDEDGDVYAMDVRAAGSQTDSCVLWHVPDLAAHAYWVTSVSVGPGDTVASGSSDGVVRIWSGGQPVGTYPIHDETVYGTAWLAGDVGFASLSYDGRLAINPRPVGST